MGLAEEVFEIIECAVSRVDHPVIGHVIPVVHFGGLKKRSKPNSFDSELSEIIQGGAEALKTGLSPAVFKGGHIDFVKDGFLPPGGLFGCFLFHK